MTPRTHTPRADQCTIAVSLLACDRAMAADATSPVEGEVRCLNLHHAAAVGDVQQCKYFLDVEGVDVNALNSQDESALYCAR